MALTDISGYIVVCYGTDYPFWYPSYDTEFSNLDFTIPDGTHFSSIKCVHMDIGEQNRGNLYYDNVLVYSGNNWVNDQYRILRFVNGDNEALIEQLFWYSDSYRNLISLIPPSEIIRRGDVLKFNSGASGYVTVNNESVSTNYQLTHGDIICFSRPNTTTFYTPQHYNKGAYNPELSGQFYSGIYYLYNSSLEMNAASNTSAGSVSDHVYVIYRTDKDNIVTDPYGYSWDGIEIPPLSGTQDYTVYAAIQNYRPRTVFNATVTYALNYQGRLQRYLHSARAISSDIPSNSAGTTSINICSADSDTGDITWSNNQRHYVLGATTGFDSRSGEPHFDQFKDYGILSEPHKTNFNFSSLSASAGNLSVRARNTSTGAVSTFSNSVYAVRKQLEAPKLSAPQGENSPIRGMYDPTGGYATGFRVFANGEELTRISGWGGVSLSSYGSSDFFNTPYGSNLSLKRSLKPLHSTGDWDEEYTYNYNNSYQLKASSLPGNYTDYVESRLRLTDGEKWYAILGPDGNTLSTDPDAPTIFDHRYATTGAYFLKKGDAEVSEETQYYFVFAPTAGINLTQWNFAPGLLQLSCRCEGISGITSPTTSWTYKIFNFSPTIEHCTMTQLSPSAPILTNGAVYDGLSYSLQFQADNGYIMPEEVSVSNVTYTWEISDGGQTGTLNFTPNFLTDTGAVMLNVTAVEGTPTQEITFQSPGDPTGGGGYGAVWADWDGTTNPVTWMNAHSPSFYLADDLSNFTTSTGYWIIGMVQYGGWELADDHYLGVSIVSGNIEYVGNYSSAFSGTNGTIEVWGSCIIEHTPVVLADGSYKYVEDITYEDELLVWNFYEGRFDSARPMWIMKERATREYNRVLFSDGSVVGFAGPGRGRGYHRIFNKEAGAFTQTGTEFTPDGTTTFTSRGEEVEVVSQEVVHDNVKYYNIITDKYYNLFANGILTSCRLSNKYKIEDMKYVGEPLYDDAYEEEYFAKIEGARK